MLPLGVEQVRTGPSPPVPARQTAPVVPPTGAVARPGPVGVAAVAAAASSRVHRGPAARPTVHSPTGWGGAGAARG